MEGRNRVEKKIRGQVNYLGLCAAVTPSGNWGCAGVIKKKNGENLKTGTKISFRESLFGVFPFSSRTKS